MTHLRIAEQERAYYARWNMLPPLDTPEEYEDWYRLNAQCVSASGHLGFRRKTDRERWYRLALKREARAAHNVSRAGEPDTAYRAAARACGIAADLLAFRLDRPDLPEIEIGDDWPADWERLLDRV